MSQDFSELFRVGYDDRTIATVDADGVALAAIKALKQDSDSKHAEIELLRQEMTTLRDELAALRRSLAGEHK